MSYVVTFTPVFLQSLEEIGDHIAQDNPERAWTWAKEVMRHCRILDTLPQGFPKAREDGTVSRDIKQLVIGKGLNKYRIIFTVFEERSEVVVLNIRHAARNPLTKDELDV